MTMIDDEHYMMEAAEGTADNKLPARTSRTKCRASEAVENLSSCSLGES